MKMSISGSVPTLDMAALKAAIRESIRTVFYKAAQKFLLAAIPRIPVWAGMARGAFRNLEDAAGQVSLDNKTGGYRIRGTRGGKTTQGDFRRGWYYYPPGGGRIERSPEAGRLFSTQPDKIFNFKGATLASGRTAYYFRFEVDIEYFDILDALRWGAFKAAGDAFVEYVKAEIQLPDIGRFIVTRRG